jgi:hypothetical protein
VFDCREIRTGRFQAFAFPAAADRTSSVRETAMPSKPRKVPGEKFDVRFAYYNREPLPHENPFGPGRGPNATAGSPSETSPFS